MLLLVILTAIAKSLKMGQHGPLFVYFRSFQTQIVKKNCGLRTQIAGVEDDSADHFTNTRTINCQKFDRNLRSQSI